MSRGASFTITVFCDGPGCTQSWDFARFELDDGSPVGWASPYGAAYFVGPQGHGISEKAIVDDVGVAASRQKYNLRHCGMDLKATPETLGPILDRLALGGVSRVSLSGLVSIVSS